MKQEASKQEETKERGLTIAPSSLIRQAIEQGADVNVLEKLLSLQERWDANQAKKAFDAAMSDVRKDLPGIVKSRKADFGQGRARYRYEDLAEIVETLSPVMAEHGLSFRWRTESQNADTVKVTCIISHREGHCEETGLIAAHDHSGNKNDIQSIGSAVTYLQRYTLKAAIGIAAGDDDDGASAGSRRDETPLRQPVAQHEHVFKGNPLKCITCGLLPSTVGEKKDERTGTGIRSGPGEHANGSSGNKPAPVVGEHTKADAAGGKGTDESRSDIPDVKAKALAFIKDSTAEEFIEAGKKWLGEVVKKKALTDKDKLELCRLWDERNHQIDLAKGLE